jgi:hypothetical protein
MFLIYDQPISTGRCECLRYNGGGDEAQVSAQRVLTLVDAFLHADHDRAPSVAEVLAMLDESALLPARSNEGILKKLENVPELRSGSPNAADL